jgi:hypothetical protein
MTPPDTPSNPQLEPDPANADRPPSVEVDSWP